MSDPTRTDAARRGVVDELRGRAQDTVTGAVDDFVFGAAETSGGSLASIARARAVLGRVLSAWGMLETAYDMMAAGYEAMTVRRKQVSRIAAAHAFGYWMFDYRLHTPPGPPRLMLDGWLTEDEAGNLDRVSAATFRHIWSASVRKTLHKLELQAAERPLSAVRDALTSQLPRAAAHQMSDADARATLKTVLGAEFNHSPRAAAAAYFLTSIAEDSMMENRVLIRMYRRFPYTPA